MKIGLVGYGSWGTALVKVLTENGRTVHWALKNAEDREWILTTGRNPRYLSQVDLNTDKITAYTETIEVFEQADLVFLVVPSAFLAQSLSGIPSKVLENKIIVSSIKGLELHSKLLISEFVRDALHVPEANFVLASGPSHAEEVAKQAVTYLAIASINPHNAHLVSEILKNHYLYTYQTSDVRGIEYASILKNIYTIAIGISLGLGYGDNFIAVFIGGCLRELQHYITKIATESTRDITKPPYLGDLLTTAYSPFSRNRQLGLLIGKGYSVAEALAQMPMIAEGYYSTASMVEEHQLHYPIAQAVYDILYQQKNPQTLFKELEKHLI